MNDNKIKRKEILEQLQDDFLGKDAYRGVTFSYSWLCNQFGHFSIGFLIAFIGIKLIPKFFDSSEEIILEMAVLSSIFITLVFEIYNYTSTIYKDNRKGLSFKPDSRNLLSDLFTDMLFFWFGAVMFYLGNTRILSLSTELIIILLFGITLFHFGKTWYIRKIYQQHAFYPFSLRLAEFHGTVNDENKKKIEDFITKHETHQHLVIYGRLRSANNGLAVAIGNEVSISMRKVYYTTMVNLMRMFRDEPEDLTAYNGRKGFWNWRKADYLVIDHIQSGVPVVHVPFIPEEVYSELMNVDKGKINQNDLCNKNVVWVLDKNPEEIDEHDYKNAWKKMIKKIGVPEKNIIEIDLDD